MRCLGAVSTPVPSGAGHADSTLPGSKHTGGPAAIGVCQGIRPGHDHLCWGTIVFQHTASRSMQPGTRVVAPENVFADDGARKAAVLLANDVVPRNSNIHRDCRRVSLIGRGLPRNHSQLGCTVSGYQLTANKIALADKAGDQRASRSWYRL